jgi:hypothetical protein
MESQSWDPLLRRTFKVTNTRLKKKLSSLWGKSLESFLSQIMQKIAQLAYGPMASLSSKDSSQACPKPSQLLFYALFSIEISFAKLSRCAFCFCGIHVSEIHFCGAFADIVLKDIQRYSRP